MAGSALRNALHRRNHKERGQLQHRSRLGLLEKKQDYVKRAKDFHSKQDRIRRLQEKAATRNKDEFYFSMIKSRTKNGVHVQDRGNEPIPVDVAKLLKSQDENYLRTVRATGRKRIAALQAELQSFIPRSTGKAEDDSDMDDESVSVAPAKGKRVIFVDDPHAERRRRSAEAKSTASTSQPRQETADEKAIDLGWRKPNARKASGKTKTYSKELVESSLTTDIASRDDLQKELDARVQRDQLLTRTLLQMQNQRLRMQNGAKKLMKREDEAEEGKTFTFDMTADDPDSEEEASKDTPTLSDWKPKVYKWKFVRKN